MNAESFDAAEETEVEAAVRLVYRLLADAIESIGGIGVAAGLVGMKAGDLRQSLDRAGRRVGIEHAIAIATRLARYNPTLTTKIASALVGPMGFEVFPRVTLPPEERAARLEAFVRSMPLGDELVLKALGGRR